MTAIDIRARFRLPIRFALGMAIACSLVACGGSGGDDSGSGGPGGDGSPTATAPSAWQQEMLTSINQHRSAGTDCAAARDPVAPLQWDAQLWEAAKRHADDMASNSHFSHTGTDGSRFTDRITGTGYRYRTGGENIAVGQTSVSQVMAD